ncbi:MAG: DUF3048 C-terminal domain-containing protein [Oscillospiraceae bacterium]
MAHHEGAAATLSFKNVFVLGTTVTLKQGGPCTDFDLSKGEGWYFTNGGYEKITWSKAGEQAPLKCFAADGTELAVNSGKSYVSVVDNEMLKSTFKIDDAMVFAPENVEPTQAPTE